MISSAMLAIFSASEPHLLTPLCLLTASVMDTSVNKSTRSVELTAASCDENVDDEALVTASTRCELLEK